MNDARYASYMGLGPKRITHWEHWSNPDAETYLSGVDYYAHPRLCRLKLRERYPQLDLPVPDTDAPLPRPDQQVDQGHGRWGDAYRDYWQQEEASRRFPDEADMLRFSPLAQGDFTDWHVVVDGDYRSEQVICHDDIVLANGPACSPAWMHRHIFPRYEEFWGLLKQAGKEVISMADGNMDAFADDVMACGARGIITEPFTDFKAIARRHPNCVLAGEGDNRVLMRNDPDEIRSMVESMVETGRMSGGYMMCIGNHIPFNVPPEAVKRYLDLSAELAYR